MAIFDVTDYGATGDGSTDDTAAIQDAIDAAVAVGSGEVFFPVGNYKVTDILIVGSTSGGGDGLGAFTGISLGGTNGLTGSTLSWAGATNKPFLKITRGRFNHIHDLFIQNTVAKGTTTAILATGPAVSMQTAHTHMERLDLRGFNVGYQAGDPSIGEFGSASDETLFTKVVFEQNTYGFYAASNYNDIKYHFEACSFVSNDYGLYTITGYAISCSGCNGGNNAVADFYVIGNGNQIVISGWDGEVSKKFLITGNGATATLDSISLRSYTLTRSNGEALIEGGGYITARNIFQGANGSSTGATGPHLFQPFYSIVVDGCYTTDTHPIWINPENSQADGLSYEVRGAVSIDNTTNLGVAAVPDECGVVAWPDRVPFYGHSNGLFYGQSATVLQSIHGMTRNIWVKRTLAAAAGSTIEIGNVDKRTAWVFGVPGQFNNYQSKQFAVRLVESQSGQTSSRVYHVFAPYAGTGGSWLEVVPLFATPVADASEYAIDVNMTNGGACSIRLRRITTAGDVTPFDVIVEAYTGDQIFNATNATGTGASASGYFGNSVLRQQSGIATVHSYLGFKSVALASLGTPADGTLAYCSDGTPGTNPLAGSGGGCFAIRQGGVWKGLQVNDSPFATLTDGATISWVFTGNESRNAKITLGGNRALSITGITSGASGTLIVKQDGTGSRTLTLPSGSKVINGGGGAVLLSTAANAIDILAFTYDGTNFFWTIGKDYS